MHQTLKLTITAVGEPGSIFMRPCDPITLHESETEVENRDDSLDLYDDEAGERATQDAAEALAQMDGPEIFILADSPPPPRRRAS